MATINPSHCTPHRPSTAALVLERNSKLQALVLLTQTLLQPLQAKLGTTQPLMTSSRMRDYTDIPLTSVAGQDKEKPSVVTFKDDPEIYETNVGADKKIDLGSFEVKKKEQALEKSDNSEEHASPYQWREDGLELKAHVKRFSTKKTYKHHVEKC